VLIDVARAAQELSDELAAIVCRVIVGTVEERSLGFASYWLHGVARPLSVRVHRARSQIGLCVWNATFTLADFCSANAALFRGKRLLELGSGTGLGGLAVAATAGASRVTLTEVDGPPLHNLAANVDACMCTSSRLCCRSCWKRMA
jgi:predicted nicotinamide N-methyase